MRLWIFLITSLLLALPSAAQQPGDVIASYSSKAEEQQLAGRYFTQQPLPDAVFSRMLGKSFPKNCTVRRSDLRYLLVLHRNAEGQTQVGELVCNKSIAVDLLYIFRKLYDADYRIGRMVLIDNYGADDERSMTANNTSCFNFRFATGSTTRVSKHGRGLAIDLNPLYNPYVKGNKISPAAGKAYAYNRSAVSTTKTDNRNKSSMIIRRGDLCWQLFHARGFRWGGSWSSLKDYQHFEK